MSNSNERGMALIATILLLALVGALLVGFVEVISSDQRSGRAGGDQTLAYSAAHAGLEKLTSDLGQLFSANYNPRCSDIDALFVQARVPNIPGAAYVAPGGGPGYTIDYQCVGGYPKAEDQPRQLSSGMIGLVTPFQISVTARSNGGGEVRMRRELQTVAIPAYQFGIFSENDLSFFAGPNFNFGGRLHTNSNLFLAQGSGGTLTLADKVTVWGEVVRKNLSNGYATEGNYDGTVRIAKSALQTTTMGFNQGSWNGAVPQLPGLPTGAGLLPRNPNWDTFSVTATNGWMRNGRTGAKRLDLPLTQMGALPIDLIRRPVVNSNENNVNAAVFGQRYFAMASLRILLSDNPADITNLPTATADPPVQLTAAGLAAAGYVVGPANPPLAQAPSANWTDQNYRTTVANAELIGGFLKIEVQLPDRTWQDVTLEILNRGIAGRNLSRGVLNTPDNGTCSGLGEPNPNAIIRLQRLRDNPSTAPGNACGNGSQVASDYWPNVLYDAREGLVRDSAGQQSERRHYLGGVMHYIELDVQQLSVWLAARGANVMQETGYVLYFSDRRGNWHDPAAASIETGEYGFEDIVNPANSSGTQNGIYAASAAAATYDSGATPDAGEDLNGDGELQTYGALPAPTLSSPLDGNARPWNVVNWNYAGGGSFLLTKPMVARVNPPVLFRRALKLVNGQRGNILAPGLTVAAENPVYVQGNYNADAGGFGATGDGHQACAVIGDAVTLLSNQWNDINSFLSPHDPFGTTVSPGRNAVTSWYRTAIISGKGLSFPRPTGYSTYQDFGTDGGAHNFLRYIEDWGNTTLNYRGSIVSFYTSRQAVGTYKCCQNVYSPPTRGYNFEVEFLTPSLLPPRTPMFRDVNTLQFRQILRATQ